MILSIAVALTLAAAPDAGPEEEEDEAPRWKEFGEGDGGIEAPAVFEAVKRSTALTVKQSSGSGGTMHFSEQTVVSCGRCGAPLVLPGSALIDHVIDLGQKRSLLLGWSSGGSGMQTTHVLLVEVGAGGPRLVDELEWFTTRGERGLLLASTPQGWRIGLPKLEVRDEEYEQDYGAVLSLRSAKSRKAAELRAAGFFKPTPPGLVAFGYAPPGGEGLRVRVDTGWLRVTGKGFSLAP